MMSAYEGEVLNSCGTVKLDFSVASVVAVSGSGPNICGHLIVYAGGGGGTYFHVAGSTVKNLLTAYPHYMSEAGYRRYLKENKKTELRRVNVKLSNPDGASLYIEELMSKKWTWGVLPNNCVAFVEEVLAAGGGDWGGSYSNCPALAVKDTIEVQAQQYLRGLERSILASYGY